MPDSQVNALIEQARETTIQSRFGGNGQTRFMGTPGGGVFGVAWMAQAGLSIPAWWSPTRDAELRRFWKKSDHLSGAIYNLTAKMTAIPVKVVARDPSIKRDVVQAGKLTDWLLQTAQFGEGWEAFFGPFIEDLITQDNGAFAEIIGPGPQDGPLTSLPFSIAHLDSWRCQRTGDPEFPVIYHDVDGKYYRLHYTRVLFMSQMRSTIAEMFGVGFCAVSRSVNTSQNLIDISWYKQEKLGSRPHRAVVITQGGLDPSDIQTAFEMTEGVMDSQGLSRYSKVVVAGSSALEKADIKIHELSGLPEGFDEETSITFGMATLALALGVDARELFPAMQAGATRADALLAHLKQRGKGPGQIIGMTENGMQAKYLPPHLRFLFDFQDDAQDRQEAEIRQVRANTTARKLGSGAVTHRIAREQMVEQGDLTSSQFERLELEDGRLPEGAPIITLFYTSDPALREMLDVGVPDPLDPAQTDPETMLILVAEQLAKVYEIYQTAPTAEVQKRALFAMYALGHLGAAYREGKNPLEAMIDLVAAPLLPADNGQLRPLEGRLRTEDGANPKEPSDADAQDDLEEDTDDTNTLPERRTNRIDRRGPAKKQRTRYSL